MKLNADSLMSSILSKFLLFGNDNGVDMNNAHSQIAYKSYNCNSNRTLPIR